MPVNRSVFASRAEEKNYARLSERWGDRFKLYHNLPFLNVISVSEDEKLVDWAAHPAEGSLIGTFRISSIDKNRLKKTSIDYTLCNEVNSPLICIEFDGLGQGHNLGVKYRNTGVWTTDEGQLHWRRQITELKLRVAHGMHFPYIVVGSRQFDDISSRVKITIVDALIGDVLARREAHARLSKGPEVGELGLTDEEFEALSPTDQHEFLQDWAIGVEVEADVTNNPVFQELQRLQTLTEHWSGYTMRPLGESRLDSPYIGAEVTLHTQKFGDVRGEAWLPNFQTPFLPLYGLVENLAELIAFDRLANLMRL